MEIHADKLIIPNINYVTKIKVDSFEFYNICKHCLDIDNYLQIKCQKSKVEFKVCGLQQSGCLEYSTTNEEEHNDSTLELLQSDDNEDIQHQFSLKYLQMLSNVCLFCNTIILQLHKNYPLCIHCNIKNGGFMKCYLAPQIID